MMQFARSTMALLFAAAVVLPVSALAADASMPAGDKAPETAADHLAMAKKYEAKAAEYKADADMHRKMLADYEKNTPPAQKKMGNDPWLAKMKTHCEGYIKDAESLAKGATAFAEYHRMRGQEMQGK